MIPYILECIVFQLVCLIIYDLFLKRETFFQWNRVYLIGTYVLSLILPLIKVEALKTQVPEVFHAYPEYLWSTTDTIVIAGSVKEAALQFSWPVIVFFVGVVVATCFLGYKLYQIYKLRKKGKVRHYKDFTQITIANSDLAFSFFKSIFLGDLILKKDYQNICDHELVHIRQKHSYDLMFFEVMRIVGWFNPLVYVYQNRVSELHEFIADKKVAKTNKKEQYELLLSQVFQTQNISFINQYFKSSLIKKRIVMIQKKRSKQMLKLKYLLIAPLVFGMLAYSAAETSLLQGERAVEIQTPEDVRLISRIEGEIEKEIERGGTFQKMYFAFLKQFESDGIQILTKEQYFKRSLLEQRYFDNMKVVFEDVVEPRPKFEIPLPSSLRYENYVNRLRAFQILDKNLRVSVAAYGQSVILLPKIEKYSDRTYVYKVEDVSDLTAKELLGLNSKLAEVLENEESSYLKIVLIDDRYAFEISKEEKSAHLSHHLRDLNFPRKNDNSLEKRVSDSETVPFGIVDEAPVFPGCENDENKRDCFNTMMQRHVSKNFNYPQEAQDKEVQGRVNLMFVIDKEGVIKNLRMRGPDKLLENEAERIIMRLPKMAPGKHEGKVVGVIYSIPISFVLDTDKTKKSSPIAKDETTNSATPFGIVDEVPVFPGCENDENKRACFNTMMQRHISKNFNYPQEAQDKGVQGRVNLMFVIGKDGVIKNLRMRGPDQLLEDEAKRIIMRLPDMKPGRHEGRNVDVPFSIPISFRLEKQPDGFQFINAEGEIFDQNQRSAAKKYNALLKERQRLLKETEDKSQVIGHLDEQLRSLRKTIYKGKN